MLNLAYWYVPAALTGVIFGISHRFRLDTPRWRRALAAHAVRGARLLAAPLRRACSRVRLALWPCGQVRPSFNWFTFSQRIFLTNMDWTLMTYSAIVGLSHALALPSRVTGAGAERASSSRRSSSEARLRTLQAELHPHFLFNTLHAISTLVHTKPDLADRMISRLSDLLRLTFDRSGRRRVPLQEELEFLAEVPRDRADAVPGSPDGALRDRSGHARRRGPAPDPAAARRERHPARRAPRSGPGSGPDRVAAARTAASGSKCATTASG